MAAQLRVRPADISQIDARRQCGGDWCGLTEGGPCELRPSGADKLLLSIVFHRDFWYNSATSFLSDLDSKLSEVVPSNELAAIAHDAKTGESDADPEDCFLWACSL